MLLRIASTAIIAFLLCSIASAQSSYPSKEVRVRPGCDVESAPKFPGQTWYKERYAGVVGSMSTRVKQKNEEVVDWYKKNLLGWTVKSAERYNHTDTWLFTDPKTKMIVQVGNFTYPTRVAYVCYQFSGEE